MISTSAALAQPKTVNVWLKAKVEIAPDGSVSALKWRDERPALKRLIAKIEPLVNHWEFLPGAIDGKPATTQTYLSVQVIGEERGDGSLELKFGKLLTGASSETQVPPSYPSGAIRARVSAEVIAEVDVGTDGKTVVRSTAFEGSRGDSYRDQFIAAAEAAIQVWTIQPERVAGHPVPAHMSIPIMFCVDDSDWCTRHERTKQANTSAQAGPVAMPIALDSVVQLVTKVEGQKI